MEGGLLAELWVGSHDYASSRGHWIRQLQTYLQAAAHLIIRDNHRNRQPVALTHLCGQSDNFYNTIAAIRFPQTKPGQHHLGAISGVVSWILLQPPPNCQTKQPVSYSCSIVKWWEVWPQDSERRRLELQHCHLWAIETSVDPLISLNLSLSPVNRDTISTFL